MSKNDKANPKLRKLIRRAITLLFGLGVVALIVIASLPKPVSVDIASVRRGALEVTVDQAGETRVKDRYIISAPITGTLGRLEIRVGDSVATGDIVARIAPLAAQPLDARSRAQSQARVSGAQAAQRQARAAVARAEAADELAQTSLQRQSALADRGGVSQQALDQARFEARARSEELSSARFGVRVADYEVRMARAGAGEIEGEAEEGMEVPAPIEGRVLRVLQESEGVVQAGAPLLEVGDPTGLEVTVDVLTEDAVNIQPGAHVVLDRWGGGKALEAHVQRLEPSAFTKVSALGVEEQRVNVVIEIDSEREQWEALGDGYRIEAQIRVWREEETLSIPSNALFRHEDGWAVFRVDGETVVRTSVQVGRRNGLDAQVLEGLEEGDTVVVHPSEQVDDGVTIRPR